MQFFRYSEPDQKATAEVVPPTLRPVLREFSDDDLDNLASFASQLRYLTGSRIVSSGERNETLYIVVSGVVALSTSSAGDVERETDRRYEGEVFGISSFLDGEESTITATAWEATEVLALRRTSFTQLAAWKPMLAIALLQDLAAYVSRRLRQCAQVC